MNPIIFDCETTGATNKTNGNPFSDSNRLCYVGIYSDSYRSFDLDVLGQPYGDSTNGASQILGHSGGLLVGFNIKFDLHWLRRYHILSLVKIQIWDCQLAYFIMTGQKHKYASLNEVAEHYGLGQKLDIVKTEYWEKGIDTDQIPPEIVREYLQQDVMLTKQIFELQIEELKKNPQLKRLVWWSCQDLLTTAEMEWNGLQYAMDESRRRGDEIKKQIDALDRSLNGMFPDISINWNSGDHLSSILYGGRIKIPFKETYIFTYKDGRTKEKLRNAIREVEFPRLVEPIKGSNLAKEGYWSTAEPVLNKLKPTGKAKEIINAILSRSSLDTKLSRYYYGLPELYNKMDWTDGLLHSSLNHGVAATGRLSSTNPNIQNLEEQMRECVITRFQT